jgi:DNA-binding Lrp family transcriptional regulator
MSKAKKSNTQNGYILLSRSLEEWQWHDQPYMMSMLIHCLFKANYKDKMWQGIKIERGSFITSIRSLAEFTGMDSKTVQKCLKNLEESGTIKRETTNRYTKIIIVNYNDYQLNTVGNVPTQRPTQAPTQRPTRRPNNIIKESNISSKEDILPEQQEKNSFVRSPDSERPTLAMIREWAELNGMSRENADEYFSNEVKNNTKRTSWVNWQQDFLRW